MNVMEEGPAFTKMTDLAAERLGGKALLCSDDFFAEKENLLKPGRGIFIPDKYTDRGKWMDGWESRRKRGPGNDWCIIQLAAPGRIHGLDVDTNHFLGNHPPFASIDALNIYKTPFGELEEAEWTEILPISPLQPGDHNYFSLSDPTVYTHLRLNIYPDGGVARLKVYGEVYRDWEMVSEDEEIDLAALLNGARPVCCNDMFFSHMSNLLMPGRGLNMGDGWETKRSRIPGNRDWVIIRMAHEGWINKVLIDTCHFRGNYPDSCLLEGCRVTDADETRLSDGSFEPWQIILPQAKLEADKEHLFTALEQQGPFTHVRLSIFPDGGVSRLRLWGRIT